MASLNQDRVEKILDELAEGGHTDARSLVNEFAEDDRVGVAELLNFAHQGDKLQAVMDDLRLLTRKGLKIPDVVAITHKHKLQPTGAERS
jgi:hypothetical protein